MLKKFIFSLLFNGLNPESGLKEKSRSAVLNSISIIGVIILLSYTVKDILANEYIIAFATAITALLIIFSIIIVGISKKIIVGTASITYIAFLFFTSLQLTSGAERAGYFWMLLFPLVSIFFVGIIHGTILTALFGILNYVLIFYYSSSPELIFNPEMGKRVIGSYIGVSLFTIAFEIIRIKAFDQLEKTSQDLIEKREQTTMILNNVKQGIFLLNDDLILSDERSSFFNSLFEKTRPDQPFLELLKDKLPHRDFVATKDYLELFFNKTVNPDLLSSINPIEKVLLNFTNLDSSQKQYWLEFKFERVVPNNGEVEILGLFRDITDQVLLEERLKKEESESLKNMENLFQIIHVNPQLMDEFLKDTSEEINHINDFLKVETNNTAEIIETIFTKIHGIKGNAMLLGLNSLADNLKEFENYIKELQEREATWRELLKLTVNLAEVKHEITQIDKLIDKIISFQTKVGDNIKNRKYIFEQNLNKSLKKLCEEYGKDVELDLEDYDIDLIPEKYRRLFKDTISQFIRNSIAHGIEDSQERINNNKNPKGQIKLSLKNQDGQLYFSYKDDGRGLSLEKIKEIAIDKKGFTKEQVQNLSSAEAVKLIFTPGFSTSDKVDNLSGQGVGMSVIKKHVENVGGKLNLKSSTGKYCEFKILLHE